MALTDWFPTTAAKMLAFFQNLLTALPGVATALKLDKPTADAALASAKKYVEARTAFDEARKTLKAAADTLAAQAPLSETNARALAKTLRSYPGITPEMLANLEMTGTETAAATGGQAKVAARTPELKLSLDGGHARVDFQKHGHQGIHLFCRRGTETDYAFLGADTYAPYLDSRPNLVAGQAEQRDYYAFFMDHDHANGAQSATFSLAVPA